MMHRVQLVLPVVKRLRDERKKLLDFWSIALFISVLLVGCGEPNPRLEHLFSLRIRTTDFPPSWHRESGGIGDRERESEGIISRWVSFRGAPEEELLGVLAWQELIDYPDLGQAAHAYTEIVEEEFPVEEWTWPEQIQFESRADQFRLACLDVQATHVDVDERYWGMYYCTAVGRYGTIISVIHVNVFKDEWLTFTDLQRLLEAADTRLASQP